MLSWTRWRSSRALSPLRVRAVKCSDFILVLIPIAVYDRLEIVGEALLNPDVKKEMPATWILPTIKGNCRSSEKQIDANTLLDLDEDRYDSALTRTQEMFKRLKTECKVSANRINYSCKD